MNRHQILSLKKKGLTYREIAIKANISFQRVHQILTGYASPNLIYKEKSSKRGIAFNEYKIKCAIKKIENLTNLLNRLFSNKLLIPAALL